MSTDALAEWRMLSGGLCVFYGSGGDFHGEPFERWLTDLEANQVKLYVGGTGAKFNLPGSVRARGRGFFLANQVPFATVTDDRIVRGFVTAGSWFGMKIAAFSWANAMEAMTWLKLDRDRAGEARRVLDELKDSVERARSRSSASVR